MSKTIKLYGPNWSAYVRTTRLALIEKEVPYELIEVDFSSGEMPSAHLQRHPFGKVPAFQHGDFNLYETAAICRYVDAAFTGLALQPTTPQPLARMAQIIAVLDAYLSAEIRMGYVYERLFKPMLNMPVDDARAEDSHKNILAGFAALASLVDKRQFLIGAQISLADLHAVPLFDYLSLSPGGNALIESQAALARWWASVNNRESVLATRYDLSVFKTQSQPNSAE